MMKKLLTMMALVVSFYSIAQDSTYNKVSLELLLGVNNPVQPMAAAHDAPTLGVGHIGLGVRYMLNPKFGLRASGGYDRFSNKSGSDPFSTNYWRVSLEGVVNAGNILHFHSWTDRLGLLLHAGAGLAFLSDDSITADGMFQASLGLTPQLKLGSRFTLSLDATATAHVYQSRTYDFSVSAPKRGVDGFLVNLSVGLHYQLGKNRVHADWVKPEDLSGKLSELDRNLALLEEGRKDDDADGVPNYLDQEPGTAAGAEVNTKGQKIVPALKDTDSDGVTDELDECPFERGTLFSKGCPDADSDGVEDKTDDCPQLAGSRLNRGCPDISPLTSRLLASAKSDITFTGGKETLTPASLSYLDRVAADLHAHPEYKLFIDVHTDAEGNDLQNLALSQRRADEIRYYLISKGIPDNRLRAFGFGETQPVAGNTTPQGRAANRRVELTIRF